MNLTYICDILHSKYTPTHLIKEKHINNELNDGYKIMKFINESISRQ